MPALSDCSLAQDVPAAKDEVRDASLLVASHGMPAPHTGIVHVTQQTMLGDVPVARNGTATPAHFPALEVMKATSALIVIEDAPRGRPPPDHPLSIWQFFRKRRSMKA